MNTINIFKTRRSIRKYLPNKTPDKSNILQILEAALWAPSAHNAQPWRFIIIEKSEKKRKLAEAMASHWNKDMEADKVPEEERKKLIDKSVKQFTNAPIIIVVCLTMEDMHKYPDEERRKIEHTMAIQSVAAAIENILLATHMKGLGACWFCAPLFCQETVRKLLGIPDYLEPQALVTLGYPAESPEAPPRKPLEEVVFWR